VLVWIHGGGWVTGWSGVDTYDGALLAAAAGAVVVTVNYRLGSLGWLHHPSLADDPTGPSGNWGLLDQLAALRWVKANIRAFGGDPARVTLGGQSSGAANVADMLVAPGADGLFWRALLHSAPFGESGNDPRRGRSWAEDLADELELPNVAALRSAPAQRIVAAHEQLLGEGHWRGTRGGAWPTLDAATLPASPAERPDARPSIDVLVGTTRDEATFMFRAGGRLEPDAAQLRAIVGQINGVEDPDGLIERYAALGGGLDANTLLVQIITEEQFRAPAARWAHARTRAGGDVHLFRVDHSAPDADLGALHTVDVPLLFGTFASGEIARRFVGDDVESRAVSSAMATQWGAFLHGDDVGWPALAAGGKSLPTAVFGGPDGPLKIEHTLGEAA
jgi:para-nitrobenzyl esterase